ncbi:MAG TPA: hypothetical protein DCZ91_02425 [Lachnospiraceae bacterium]|nr:hypothetical protein [Lachnospiraceae bacterium]
MLEAVFNPENAVFCLINRILDLILLSLIWALCCIPVLTIGAASSALYHAVVKAVRYQRSYPLREFWKSFRLNLKKGILIQIIWMVPAALMLAGDAPLFFVLLAGGEVQDKVFLVFSVLKLLILVGMLCWIYPLLSRFEESVLRLAEAALYLILRYFPITLLSVFLLLGAALLLAWEPLLVAVIPGPAALLLSILLEPPLRKMVRYEEMPGEDSDAWYMGKR